MPESPLSSVPSACCSVSARYSKSIKNGMSEMYHRNRFRPECLRHAGGSSNAMIWSSTEKNVSSAVKSRHPARAGRSSTIHTRSREPTLKDGRNAHRRAFLTSKLVAEQRELPTECHRTSRPETKMNCNNTKDCTRLAKQTEKSLQQSLGKPQEQASYGRRLYHIPTGTIRERRIENRRTRGTGTRGRNIGTC